MNFFLFDNKNRFFMFHMIQNIIMNNLSKIPREKSSTVHNKISIFFIYKSLIVSANMNKHKSDTQTRKT